MTDPKDEKPEEDKISGDIPGPPPLPPIDSSESKPADLPPPPPPGVPDASTVPGPPPVPEPAEQTVPPPPPGASDPPLPPTQKDVVVYHGDSPEAGKTEEGLPEPPPTDSGNQDPPPPPPANMAAASSASPDRSGSVPPTLSNISTIMIVAGGISIFISLAAFLFTFGICFWSLLFIIPGGFYIYQGIQMQKDPWKPVPIWIPIAMCVHILMCDIITVGLGSWILILLNNDEYKSIHG